MPRKKLSFPDRSQPIGVRRKFPDDGGFILNRESVDTLARRHNIRDDYDLLRPLDEAFDWYFLGVVISQRQLSYAEQKSYLQETADCAARLRECLERMGTETKWSVQQAWRQNRSKQSWHTHMSDDARGLELAARRALNQMPHYSGADLTFKTLLNQLIDIYEDAKNKRVTGVTKSAYKENDTYTDALTVFVLDCLRSANIPKTNSAIGQALHTAIRRRKQARQS